MRMGKRMRAQRAFRRIKKKVRSYEDEAAQDKAICLAGAVVCIVVMVVVEVVKWVR